MNQASPPIEKPPSVSTEYPSMIIDGKKYEKIGTHSCHDCGRPVDFFVVRVEEGAFFNAPHRLGYQQLGGRHVEWASSDLCPSCGAMASMMADKTREFKTRRSDRGIRRDVLAKTIEWLDQKKTAMARLESEVLGEILSAHAGDWIATEVLRSHPYAAQIDPIIVNLVGESAGPGASFGLGRVEVEVVNPMIPLRSPRIDQLLDRHTRLDFGEHGLAPEISPAARFCPFLATVAEVNRATIDAGLDGPIRSLYTQPDLLPNRRRWCVEIGTFLSGGKAIQTLVLARMIPIGC